MSSTPKKMLFEEEARQHVCAGINELTQVVACTLGPKGRNVGIEESFGAPSISNEGYKVAKNIEVDDDFKNMGLSMAKEMMQKVNDECGDGTTTALLLLDTLVKESIKRIAASGSAIEIKRGLEKACDFLIKEINNHKNSVASSEEIKNIATVSASGNLEIGATIAKALHLAGPSGLTLIEEGKSTETSIEQQEGMEINRGFLSPYFCTDREKMIVEMDKPSILIIDQKINSIHELLPTLQNIASTGRPLAIIADDIDGDALSTLVMNKLRGTLKVAVIKSPGFGDKKKELLQDLAALTGATVIAEDKGIKLNTALDTFFGSCEKLVIKKESTMIVSGHGTKEAIDQRIQIINHAIKNTSSDYEIKELEKRKAKLVAGVVIIYVGAETESALKQNKQTYENALNATKAAQEEGVVTGGGVAYLHAAQALDSLELSGDEKLGVQVLKMACERPIMQLAENSGLNPAVIASEVLKKGETSGLNVQTLQVEDLKEKGILDPTKVIITALTKAVSTAKIAILTSVLLADDNED